MLEVTLGLEILEALREHAKDIDADEIPTWHVDRPNDGDRYYYCIGMRSTFCVWRHFAQRQASRSVVVHRRLTTY